VANNPLLWIFPTQLMNKNSLVNKCLISHAEGAAGRGGGDDECGFHVNARFRIIKHNGNGELDSGAGDFVRSLTHTFARRDIAYGFTCEVCLLFIFIYFGKKD
jgi:hypothetical protein